MKAERIHDVGAVDGDGVNAEAELGGDFLVGFAGDDVLKDFEFTRSEAGVAFALEIAGKSDLRVKDGFAFGDFLDSGDEVEVHGVFKDVAAGTGFKRLADERVFGMHAEHEDRDIGRFCEDAARGFDAVDLGKRTVHDDYVGMELFGELNGFEAVAGFAHDLERRLVFEDPAEAAADKSVVVDEEDCQFIRHVVSSLVRSLLNGMGHIILGHTVPAVSTFRS